MNTVSFVPPAPLFSWRMNILIKWKYLLLSSNTLILARGHHQVKVGLSTAFCLRFWFFDFFSEKKVSHASPSESKTPAVTPVVAISCWWSRWVDTFTQWLIHRELACWSNWTHWCPTHQYAPCSFLIGASEQNVLISVIEEPTLPTCPVSALNTILNSSQMQLSNFYERVRHDSSTVQGLAHFVCLKHLQWTW